MMDKKPHIKPYLYGMLAGFGAISLSILFFFLIYRFQGFGDAISKLTGILMPFIYGAVIAYLLKPVCNCVEDFLRRLLPEKMGTAANMLAVTVRTKLVPSMQSLLSGAALGVMSFVTFLKNIIIGVIVSVYLLASRKKFGQQCKMILYSLIKPRWADIILEEILYADKMFGGFINGKILDSAIIGVLCYIACLIFKFPSALLVSVISGVTNVIPFFGPFIGAIPATLLILIQNPIKALWFVLFVLVLQQVDGNIIGPKILGNTTGLSSFWVLFAILLFGGLWGFVGMIIGVPLFAVIYDVLKKFVFHGLRRNEEMELVTTYHDNFGDPDDE